MELVEFGKSDIENVIAKMDAKAIDQLAFGAVELDRTGKVIKYNVAEGAITGRDPKDVIGRNFFTEVAPCTRTETFYGRFTKGVATGSLNAMFEYTFDYKMTPTRVKVHMKKALVGDNFWVFIKRL
ncbi:MAG TPA: photoactive yellow protein [Alphaproteobacteria bacterium]|nr:photoactive yellow protein [Alphaproteobacteria bacterium]